MKPVDAGPSPSELRAMAFVDGELAGADLREFERELAERADLRLEVARLQQLAALARHAAGPEPLDHEWRALEREPVQRGATALGWFALAAGALTLATFALWWLWSGSAHIALKLAVSALALGATLLFLTTLRARLATGRLDPYRSIER